MGKTIRLIDTNLTLLPERALLLPDYGTLIVTDWHLGKSTHFRKAGIFIPPASVGKDVQRLQSLLESHPVRTVVFLGDLFHSVLNSEWHAFEQSRAANLSIRFVLTRGNHDILPDKLLEATAVEVVTSYSIAPHIYCTHHPQTEGTDGQLNIAGHLHPGCSIPAKARQACRLPCFYYHNQTLLLPAFGSLTGLYLVQPGRDAHIYPIVADKVWEWAL